jgi:3-oxoacyl-[acyl-carrier protein] reductase
MGYRWGRGSSTYAASKAGVIGLTKALAQEMAGRVRVNAIAPGYIRTEMTKGLESPGKEDEGEVVHNEEVDVEKVEEMKKVQTAVLASKEIAAGRFGTVEEVAQVALMLATNEYMNGSTVVVDGGLVYE